MSDTSSAHPRAENGFVARFTREQLTMVPEKIQYYAAENAFTEALLALDRAAPGRFDEDSAGERIRGIGLGLFRPDAIAHDRVGVTLDYLSRRHIRPFYARILNVQGPTVRRLWRYQLNSASPERLRLLDLIFDAGDSILVLFWNAGAPCVPCSVLMADTKGSAVPSRRAGWELRSVLGSPSRVESYFHTSDEPADVVREGAILLGPRRFASMLRAWTTGARPEPVDVTSDVHGAYRLLASVPTPELRDDVLSKAAAEHGIQVTPTDRWAVLRALGDRLPMFAGDRRNLIGQTGSRQWWDRWECLGTVRPDHESATEDHRFTRSPS